MKLTTGGKLTGNATQTIQSRFMKILIVASFSGLTSEEAINQFDEAKIELESTHHSYGTRTIIYKQPLLDLLEIAACNEGAVRVNKVGDIVTIRGTVELSEDGAFEPKESEIFKLNFELPDGASVDVYTIDADSDAITTFSYKQTRVFAESPSPIDVAKAKFISFRKNELKKLELEMFDGQKVTYHPEEIEQICSEGNEFSYNVDGLVTMGGKKLLTLNVANAARAHVTNSQDANVYVVREHKV